MTFTNRIKEELCRLPHARACCALAECLGLLLYCSQFSPRRVRLVSEIPAVRRRVQQLFNQVFGFAPSAPEGQPRVLELTDSVGISSLQRAFGYDGSTLPLQLNRAVIEEDCCKSAFIRGAFLMGGYATISGKGYHLELVTARYPITKQVSALLLDMELPAAYIQRRGNHILYYKDSAVIEDFLTAAGATGSAMQLMLHKVERDLRNRVNRQVNCETANLSKTVEAAARQTAAIEALQSSGRLAQLPAALRLTAQLRLENPEMSLSELCELFDPPLSRAGLSARIRKLVQLSEERQA